MASNGALAERNERVKYARTLGIEKPHMLKAAALEEAIKVAETEREARKAAKTTDDPFDDIDPTLEGDHLTEDVFAPETVAEGVALRESVREAWLMDAVTEIKGLFRQAGYPQADTTTVAISTGFPQGNVRKIIGQCHHADNNGGIAHIYINPTQDDTMRVLEIVAHEFDHAMGHKGHTGEFRKAALAVGLVGTGGKTGHGFTSTDIGEDAKGTFEDIANKLGTYPHTKVNLAAGGIKKQTTRMLKVACVGKDVEDEETGESEHVPCEVGEDGEVYTIRMSKKWAEIGMPTCPCGGEMILEEKDGE